MIYYFTIYIILLDKLRVVEGSLGANRDKRKAVLQRDCSYMVLRSRLFYIKSFGRGALQRFPLYKWKFSLSIKELAVCVPTFFRSFALVFSVCLQAYAD